MYQCQLEELVAHRNIIDESKAHGLPWLGHLEKMSEHRKEKRAYLGQDQLVGRTRYPWNDAMKANLRDLQTNNWREKTEKSRVISFRRPSLIMGR